MELITLHNYIFDEIDKKLDAAFKEVPEAEVDREIFRQALINHVCEHGIVPDFKLQKK